MSSTAASRLLLRSTSAAAATRRLLLPSSSASAASCRHAMLLIQAQKVTSLASPRFFSTVIKPEDTQSIAQAIDKASDEVVREGNRSILHFKLSPNRHPLQIEKLKPEEKVWETDPSHHSVWTNEEVNSVKITHLEPKDGASRAAYYLAQTLRHTFDLLAGFKTRKATEDMYLNRVIFLETVAGVPGMVGGMIRHLHSLRRMKRDHGWIHTLIEEAENERMHLLTFMKMKEPSMVFRGAVMIVQGVFFNVFFSAYLINPKICHSLVGYIEEEAVKTYTHIIEQIDAGDLPQFNTMPVPPIAMSYWKLAPNATFRDLMLAIRADEANHREVNHTFSRLKEDQDNPFVECKKYLGETTTPATEKK